MAWAVVCARGMRKRYRHARSMPDIHGQDESSIRRCRPILASPQFDRGGTLPASGRPDLDYDEPGGPFYRREPPLVRLDSHLSPTLAPNTHRKGGAPLPAGASMTGRI